MPTAMKALYVKKHFNDKKTRENALDMVENLKKSFKDSLNKVCYKKSLKYVIKKK